MECFKRCLGEAAYEAATRVWQAAGQTRAAEAQQQVVAMAEANPDSTLGKYYKECGGLRLEALLAPGDPDLFPLGELPPSQLGEERDSKMWTQAIDEPAAIDLIDAQYLVSLAHEGTIIPRWQEVPSAARINKRSVGRLRSWNHEFSLPILVISYPWLEKWHPDPRGQTLQRILPILRAMIKEAKRYGTHATIGVLWDYMSLPQPSRNPAEEARFQQGMKQCMNLFYAHPFTTMLAVTTPIPIDATNQRPYNNRGWCFMEKHISGIVKDEACMWDLSLHTEGAQITFQQCRSELTSCRQPLVSPVWVRMQLKERLDTKEPDELAFTKDGNKDLEVVSDIYQRGFEKAFAEYSQLRRQIDFQSLGWKNTDVAQLTDALRYLARNCSTPDEVTISLYGNDFSATGVAELQKALPPGSTKFRLEF